MLCPEMTSHCKSAAIQDSFGHNGAFFLGELHYTESKHFHQQFKINVKPEESKNGNTLPL